MKKAILHLSERDRRLAGVIERVGKYAIQYREPHFETLVRSIVYQQLSGKAAATIYGRLAETAKVDPLTPESILKLRPQKLRTLGLSQQKLDYIRGLAKLAREGEVDFAGCSAMDDACVIEHLTKAKGVGVWTAQMFLIFALRRPDVLPLGDLGLRTAMQRTYGLAEPPKPAEMAQIAEPWRPYSSVATWYMWRSLDGSAAL